MSYKEYKGTYVAKTYCPGTSYEYTVRVPDAPEGTEYAVLVTHDRMNWVEADAMDVLAARGEAPWCVTLGMPAGDVMPTLEGGFSRHMRAHDYDFFAPAYANLFVEEFIPYICETYGIRLSPDPDMHAVSGGSSGAMSAWNLLWFRNDYFRRGRLCSPSFIAIGRGREVPEIIRKSETKPIRAYVVHYEHEPDDYFCSSHCAAEDGIRAMRYAGYDIEERYFPGEAHCGRTLTQSTSEEIFAWLWKDWETCRVKTTRNSPRHDTVISYNDPWEDVTATDTMPSPAPALSSVGEYTVKDGKVYLEKDGESRVVADDFLVAPTVAVSSDLWRLYMADPARGSVHAASICEDGSLKDEVVLAPLYTAFDFRRPGAYDMCVDEADRVFVATELGIQCIRSFGLVDVLLNPPHDGGVRRVAFGGDGRQYLYADCGDRLYRRKMLRPAKNDPLAVTEPGCKQYYD